MKNKWRIIILNLIIICNVSCNQSDDTNVIKEIEFENIVSDSSSCQTICKIDESSQLIKYGVDLKFLNDTTFILVTSNCVHMYNTDGKHIKKIGDRGNASGEYTKALVAYVTDKFIYVNCALTSKVIRYDLNGNFARCDILPFSAVNYVVDEDNGIFYGYSTYQRDENCFIKAFDFEKKYFTVSYGDPTTADNLLMCYNWQGGLNLYQDKIYYVAPSKLEVNIIEDGESRVLCRVVNSDFNVDLDSKYIDENNSYGFSSSNSTARSVYRNGDRIYLLAQTGRFYSKDNSDEVINIFEMSADGDPIKQTILEGSSDMMFPHCYYNGYLYYVKYGSNYEEKFINRIKL